MKRYVNIGNKKVGEGHSVFIIAEAGVNHNGSLRLAKKMVGVAKSVGADAIKFQTFKTEGLVVKRGPQFNMLRQLELNKRDFKALSDYCRKKKIIFLSTPFDSNSSYFLYKLGVPAFKIASGELTNVPLLQQVAGYIKPVILSTGMSTLKEVVEAVKVIYSAGNRALVLLHCTSNYPAKYSDVNLRAMDTLKKKFDTPVGYSDHTKGLEVSVAAVARGANIIEKHFTLDRTLPGPDHKASLEPDELKSFVNAIRNTEKAMGDGIKKPCYSEDRIKKIARKSIVAACDIPRGSVLTEDMLSIKRPGRGIEPRYLSRLIKKRTRVNVKKDQVFTWEKVII